MDISLSHRVAGTLVNLFLRRTATLWKKLRHILWERGSHCVKNHRDTLWERGGHCVRKHRTLFEMGAATKGSKMNILFARVAATLYKQIKIHFRIGAAVIVDNVDICLMKGVATSSGQIDSPFSKGSATQLYTISKSLLQRSSCPVRKNGSSLHERTSQVGWINIPFLRVVATVLSKNADTPSERLATHLLFMISSLQSPTLSGQTPLVQWKSTGLRWKWLESGHCPVIVRSFSGQCLAKLGKWLE